MFSTAWSAITGTLSSALGGIWGYVAAAVLSASLAAFGAYEVTAAFKDRTIGELKLADSQAMTNAVTAAKADLAARDKVTLDAAVSRATSQQKIVTQTVTITKEIPAHVTPAQDARTCITYGLVRVFDAAAGGADPDTLSLPAGQSDDACAPVKASDLARSVAENYGSARDNADQLTALQGWVRQQGIVKPQ